MSLQKLIPVVNKLHDVFNAVASDPLDLPTVVVVGGQSSGKSSVLEAIVGRDFLPRGSGIVTRRPLVLQLIHLPPSINHQEEDVEWGEFLHKPSEMFYDFDKIREEIEKETDRLTGKNKGISDQAINLKIYSSHVLNLTLIDLPGITRVPIGDQPPDIEKQIRNMVKSYISNPNSIILAITASNTDLTNSDALQMAKEADPEGVRTLGVLTKIDIMDAGTNALDALMGRVVPLKLGYIGVINRSQQDIIRKKPIREALDDEKQYFESHSVYRNISQRLGTQFLAKTLNKLLIQHIRNTLPELKSKVNKMLADAQQEMLTYGDPLYDTKGSQGALLLQIITRFVTNYGDVIDGKAQDISTNELYGGARISYIFNETFGKCLDVVNPTEGLGQDDIRTAIRNANGPKAALFVPEQSFELLVRGQIIRLEEPCIQCVDLVYEELQRIVAQVESKELLRFANLRNFVVEVVNGLLNKYKLPTKEMIQNLINIEMSFINTNHPDFVGADNAISIILDRMAKQNQPQSQSQSQSFNSNPNLSNSRLPPSSSGPPLPLRSNSISGSHLTSLPPSQSSNNSASQPTEGQQGFLSVFFGRPQANPSDANSPLPNANNQMNQYGNNNQGQQHFNQNSFVNPMATLPNVNNQMNQYGSNNLQQNYNQSNLMMNANQRGTSLIPPPKETLGTVPLTIKPSANPTDKETFETELIKYLLVSYFDVVKKNVKDSVPKSIMHFLVNKSRETMQNELVSSLYKEELFEELLQESSVIQQRREACKSMMDILRKAHEILNEVRDFQL